ncbi:fused MFS/spermidine synthase [Thermodesulfobacteriota bacterium]
MNPEPDNLKDYNNRMKYSYTSRSAYLKNFIALFCFFISGFAGLLYEICWIRKASLAFGSTTLAISTVVAVFFGGLALGSYFSGRYSIKITNPLKVYAVLEIILGAIILFNPMLFLQAEKLFSFFYPILADSYTLLSFFRFIIAVILILPPTILMGATLPVFCKQYVTNDKKITFSVGLLYGLNTLGAVMGCVICGLYLIPLIGVNQTIYLGGILNLIIGFIILGYIKNLKGTPSKNSRNLLENQSSQDSSPATSFMQENSNYYSCIVSILFFFAGFTAIGNEILWTRYLSLIFHNTVYTYTLTLAVTLSGIVLGSIFIALFADRSNKRERIFGILHILIGLSVFLVPLLPAETWRNLIDSNNLSTHFIIFNLVLLVPAILTGAAFPLAIRMVTSRTNTAAFKVGKMSAVNTAGGISGSLAMGFIIFPILGIYKSLLISTGISLILGFSALIFLDRPFRRRFIVPVITISIIVWYGIPSLTNTKLPEDFLGESEILVDFHEGISANLAVLKKNKSLSLEIDRMWQGQSIKGHQIMAAHIPMLLHDNPKNVLVVGAGVGLTASRFLYYDIDILECVDIEKELFGFVQKHFESSWMDDPRTKLIVEDGRNYISHTEHTYDIISIEVGQVFRPGLASFYTSDFYKRVKERLNKDGIACQFVPILFFDLDEFKSVIRTFTDTFPQSVLMYNTSEFLLIGSINKPIQFREKRLSLLNADRIINEDLDFAYWGGSKYNLNQREIFAAGFLCGPESLSEISSNAPLYRDDRPVLEYKAAINQTSSPEHVINYLRSFIEPPGSILDKYVDENTAAKMIDIRDQNLKDIQASYLAQNILHHSAEDINDLSTLEKALEHNPQNIQIRLQLGIRLSRSGNFHKAITQFVKVIESDPVNLDARINLGIAYMYLGNMEKSLASLFSALKLNPGSYEVHINLGMVFQKQKKWQSSIKHFKEALRLEPHSAEAYYNIGNTMLSLNMLDEAVENYALALQLRPDMAEAAFNTGVAYLKQDMLHEAIGHYLKVIQINPGYIEAYNNVAYAYGRMGEYSEAVKYYKQVIQFDPNAAEAYANVGDMFNAQGDREEAVKYYSLALKIKPDYSETASKLHNLKE